MTGVAMGEVMARFHDTVDENFDGEAVRLHDLMDHVEALWANYGSQHAADWLTSVARLEAQDSAAGAEVLRDLADQIAGR